MSQDARNREIALQTAREAFAPRRVEDALVEPGFDSSGEDALWIMIVIASADMPLLNGSDMIRFMMTVRERLEREGEQRRSIPRFATPEDLAEDLIADADSEP